MTELASKSIGSIAVIAYHSSPLFEPGNGDGGGMTVYVRALAQKLAERGIHTDIFTRATSELGRVVQMMPGVRVISIEAGPVGPLEKEQQPEFIADFSEGVRAFATMQRLRYDLIHSHYWQSGVAGEMLSRVWGAPLVHSHHTLGRVKNRFSPPGEPPEPQIRLDGEAKVIDSADVLVSSTEEEFWQLACMYGASHDRLKILHPGVDHSRFTPGPRSAARAELGLEKDGRLLLCAGRIQPLKGMDLAIRALVHLPADVKLLVVGGASGRVGTAEIARLKDLAASEGLDGRVEFCGPHPHERLPHFYRAADVAVVTSYSESFGLTALEAHACGIPVVATSVGGLVHIVEDGTSGYLVDNRDPKNLAGRLSRILDGRALRASFSARAIERASNFSWDKVADSFIELYECLVREEFPEACTC